MWLQEAEEEEAARLEFLQREREQRELESQQEQEEWEERRRQMQREEEEWEEQRKQNQRRREEEQSEVEREERERLQRQRQEEEERMNAEQRRREEEQRRLEEDLKAEQQRREEEKRRQEEELLRAEREERERQEREEREKQLAEQRRAVAEADKERQRQKELLLAKMKAIDESNTGVKPPSKSPSPSESPSRQRRNYTFTKPIENLHNGKPSYDPTGTVPVVNKRRDSLENNSDEELSFGGYAPTFSSKPKAKSRPSFLNDNVDIKPKNAAAAKKTNLMADLFGSSSTSKMDSGDDDPFGSSKPVPAGRRISGAGNDTFNDRSESPGSLLPRRGRQASTTLTKPAVNAIDDLDEDLEEVVL